MHLFGDEMHRLAGPRPHVQQCLDREVLPGALELIVVVGIHLR